MWNQCGRHNEDIRIWGWWGGGGWFYQRIRHPQHCQRGELDYKKKILTSLASPSSPSITPFWLKFFFFVHAFLKIPDKSSDAQIGCFFAFCSHSNKTFRPAPSYRISVAIFVAFQQITDVTAGHRHRYTTAQHIRQSALLTNTCIIFSCGISVVFSIIKKVYKFKV